MLTVFPRGGQDWTVVMDLVWVWKTRFPGGRMHLLKGRIICPAVCFFPPGLRTMGFY